LSALFRFGAMLADKSKALVNGAARGGRFSQQSKVLLKVFQG
jgi:hypothetical protein